jgi:hypothetical protein
MQSLGPHHTPQVLSCSGRRTVGAEYTFRLFVTDRTDNIGTGWPLLPSGGIYEKKQNEYF